MNTIEDKPQISESQTLFLTRVHRAKIILGLGIFVLGGLAGIAVTLIVALK